MNPADIELVQMPHSPFCIPVAQILRTCGLPFKERNVPNWDRSEILRLTNGAYYQVPVLIHGDTIVFESGPATQDVARYVDQQFAGGRLFPEALAGLQAIVIDYLEDDVEGVTFRLADPHYLDTISDVAERGMIIRHKERKFGRGCVETWRQNAVSLRAEADRMLERFEITLRYSPFLFGESPVYSDFLLFGIVGNLTYNGWNQLDPEKQRALIRWQEAMRNLRWVEPKE